MTIDARRMAGDAPPQVLVVDEEIPWPTNTGKRLRTLNLLTELAREFQIDLLVHSSNTDAAAVAELARRNISVHFSPSRLPDKGGASFPLRIAASLAAGLPYSVYSHYQRRYQAELQSLIESHNYQLIHCEWTPYALYLDRMTLPVCIAAHNVEWMIWDRMAQADGRLSHRALYRAQAMLMRRFEKRVFGRYDRATAVSQGDADALRELGCRDAVVVPNGVDADHYQPYGNDAIMPQTLVFTGSLDWRPNQDAIAWFARDVHPLLKRRYNDYRFFVVGRTPPAWMRDPAVVPPELIVTGTVDDVRPWIAKGAVYVVPLRAGGGSRLKILEALAMGKAVVSTTVGMEGLDLEPDAHLLVADTPAAFVERIVELMENPQRRDELGRAGRARIEALYRWPQIAPVQARLWRQCIEGASRMRS